MKTSIYLLILHFVGCSLANKLTFNHNPANFLQLIRVRGGDKKRRVEDQPKKSSRMDDYQGNLASSKIKRKFPKARNCKADVIQSRNRKPLKKTGLGMKERLEKIAKHGQIALKQGQIALKDAYRSAKVTRQI